jgi:hypothetical protein
MNSTRYGLSGALGPDGRIYAIDGSGSGGTTSAEAYDPIAGNWTSIASLSIGREEAAATLAPDGRIYVMGGGFTESSVEAYNIN